ncbi:NAD(P)-dependent dehydrogenase (short-subunit alcohol dehydrogenase family) [Clostridium algifaecis]|uniref:NAD(P)-dependent dehydrogenase (Short-subunit alcohol dehydrogenase family) n=1 Tax=Clostridium algifaecis TaxID=1472040 RepID=A0ABS4KVK5_9CLOT|nr:NAD(P)-dependent dehydrogenase (short-subunit alcohol dehydrogenase family) [Clostridium algifaecis]
MNFNDKVCVITGGANGIGRCIVESFLNSGAKVAVIDTDLDSEQMIMSQYSNDRLYIFHGDITEEHVLNNFANQVIQQFKKIDYLINNACISKKGILSGCGFDDFNYVLKLGITASSRTHRQSIRYCKNGTFSL